MGRSTARRDPTCGGSAACSAAVPRARRGSRAPGGSRTRATSSTPSARCGAGASAGEPELLASCHRWAVALAAEHGCHRIAFPAISTGVYGYPLGPAARVALGATAEALDQHPDVEEARFWLFDARAHTVFASALAELEPRLQGAAGAAAPPVRED